MGKYALVASYYSLKTKRYDKETLVKVDGYDFSKLQDIDKFTLGNSKSMVWNTIRRENNVEGCNFLSIRYVKNQDADPVYYMVMFDNKELLSCVNDLKLGIGSQGKYTYSIAKNNAFFGDEKEKLLVLIEKRDYEQLDSLVGKRGHLRFLIDRYLNSFYDYGEEDKRIRDLADIVLEFSRYKTFRGWIVSNKKLLLNNINNRSVNVSKNNQNGKNSYKAPGKKIKNRGMEEKDFLVDEELALDVYNKSNEEFLAKDEFYEMGLVVGYDESMELFGDLTKKKGK